jgi:hypothetical protein
MPASFLNCAAVELAQEQDQLLADGCGEVEAIAAGIDKRARVESDDGHWREMPPGHH